MPSSSSVVVTHVNSLARELFTHMGAGTLRPTCVIVPGIRMETEGDPRKRIRPSLFSCSGSQYNYYDIVQNDVVFLLVHHSAEAVLNLHIRDVFVQF